MIVRNYTKPTLRAGNFGDYGDGLIQFPGDSKQAVAALDVDFRATNDGVVSAGLTGSKASYWSALYSAWRAWADPVLDSWSFNPVSAAAFVKQSEIADWRSKLQQQQADLRDAGASEVPSTLDSEQDKPASLFGAGTSTLIYGGIALAILLVVVPRVLPKK